MNAITLCGSTIGLLAVAPGRIGWIDEEVIDADHRGHGYATSAQSVLAAHPSTHRERLLIGTIDRHNTASRISAERAGRPRVLDDVFLRSDHHRWLTRRRGATAR